MSTNNIWAAAHQNQQMTCAPSEDFNQPAHLPSPISLRCALHKQLRTHTLFRRTAKTDQTRQMPRLIGVFAGRKGHFVGFVVRRLICFAEAILMSTHNKFLRRSVENNPYISSNTLVPTLPISLKSLQEFWGISIIWAPSSEFVSSSIPSWQILTAHAQPFREARDLAFCLRVPLDSLLVRASSEGSGETARMLA